jgi:hypothetical protein
MGYPSIVECTSIVFSSRRVIRFVIEWSLSLNSFFCMPKIGEEASSKHSCNENRDQNFHFVFL